MTTDAILLRQDEAGVTTLTLNRPAARNALSSALLAALQRALDGIAGDRAVRVVVLAAAGPVFCAGHDLRELRGLPDEAAQEALFRRCSALMMTLTRLPQPVIAAVQGMATAAGCQLVASCDLAVAAEGARFATPGVRIGLFCSTPMVALTRAIGRKPAMEMLLTGEAVEARRAAELGLVNRVVPADRLTTEAAALARQVAGHSTVALTIGKAAFYEQAERPLADAYALTGAAMARNMMAADAAEGIDAFLDKRQPVWRGC